MARRKLDAMSLYREARRPHHTEHRTYQTGAANAWAVAQRNARTYRLWRAAESARLVRLETMADDYCEPLDAGFYDPAKHPGHPGGARALAAERKRAAERLEAWGMVVVLGQYRTAPDHKWETGDSIGGIEGDADPEDAHGYGPDIMEQTLAELRRALRAEGRERAALRLGRCPRCHGTGRCA